MTQKEAEARYGKIVDGKWSEEAKWMMVQVIPVEYSASWINSATGKPVSKIYINKDMAPMLMKALALLKASNLLSELKTFDGCFNIRKKRGLTSLSLHSWGLAIDVNAFENGLGVTPKLSPRFVKCFTDNGFTWGGTWQRKDGMHFQLAKI
jgi:hypothetical protein